MDFVYRLKNVSKLNIMIFMCLILVLGSFGYFMSLTYFPDYFNGEAYLVKSEDVRPNEPVVIRFSHRLIPRIALQSVKVSPNTEVVLELQNGNRDLYIHPKTFWQPDENFEIKIENAKTVFFGTVNDRLLFNTEEYPKLVSFYPVDNQKDVVIGVEDPIKAVFDKTLDIYKVKFVVSPEEELVYQLRDLKTAVELLPKDQLEMGKKYAVEIYLKYKDQEDYQKIHQVAFVTQPPPLPPEEELKAMTPVERVKRTATAKIWDGKYIDINLKEQVMAIFENGELLDAYRISTGKRGMETPVMETRVYNKHPRPWSREYSLFMPYWMAITPTGKYGIHELPEWPGGIKEGANHLGIPVSHGCVRLGVGAAGRVYTWAEIGTPVISHY